MNAGLLSAVYHDNSDSKAYQPACDPDDLTVNTAMNALSNYGNSNFIVKADKRFAKLLDKIIKLRDTQQSSTPDITLLDLMK